jgi:ParB family chromosome partitioning protein
VRRALGKGLTQLLGEQFDSTPNELPVLSIVPNQRQPRTEFDNDALEELAESIKIHGVLQPILVRPLSEGKYELIAGERRWRASQLAGLDKVPVIIRSAAGQESLELALIENVQRADISVLDAAVAYKRLADEFGLTQEEIGLRVGKTRTSISNTLRLLKLPTEALGALRSGQISEGHARALLGITSESKLLGALAIVVAKSLSVRQTEQLVESLKSGAKEESKPKKDGRRSEPKDVYTLQLESAISERFSSPTKIERSEKGGRLVVEFYGDEDLERILELLGVEI